MDGVDLRLERGRTLGIVGESGCGKSVTALSIMGLVPQPPGRIAGGEVLFEGEDLLKLPAARLRDLRGDQLSMIFQEPMSSLNPAFPVGEQIAETLLRHRHLSRHEAKNQTIEMLRRVRIPAPERRADDYPHQLSGGMRQRVMIAMALACNPKLLIAALEAGEAAGGDKRGKQSAALIIHAGEDYAALDLRVDDHVEPLGELRRLYDKAHERFIPYLRCAPSKARPWGVVDRVRIEEEIARYKRPA